MNGEKKLDTTRKKKLREIISHCKAAAAAAAEVSVDAAVAAA